jgi:hypothetical protein
MVIILKIVEGVEKVLSGYMINDKKSPFFNKLEEEQFLRSMAPKYLFTSPYCIAIRETVIIGRVIDGVNDINIKIANPFVSERQCAIVKKVEKQGFFGKTKWYVEDLESKNGTFVEDKHGKRRLKWPEQHELKIGDFIILQGIRFIVDGFEGR